MTYWDFVRWTLAIWARLIVRHLARVNIARRYLAECAFTTPTVQQQRDALVFAFRVVPR